MATDGKYAYRRKQTVYATEALPGVPKGTKGFVILPGGITWHRYRVRFENGVELGLIDEGKLSAKPVPHG